MFYLVVNSFRPLPQVKRDLTNKSTYWQKYFSGMPLCMPYVVVKFRTSSYNTFWDMNFYLVSIFVKSHNDEDNFFLECSSYFSRIPLCMPYNVLKFQTSSYNAFWDMNFYLVWIFVKSQADRQKVTHMSPPCIRTGGLKNVWKLVTHFLKRCNLEGWPSPHLVII